MTKKMKKQGGFTLVEMLIVVAIIAILIAVSIPLVTEALEKAKEATDAANERSFKAVLTIKYLSSDYKKEDVYIYDAVAGTAGTTEVTKGYGQGTTTGDDKDKKEGMVLYGSITDDGTVYMQWSDSKIDTALTKDGKLTHKILLGNQTNEETGG